MPAYSDDDDPLLDPEELPPPNFASVLLVDLDVADEPQDVQRRAVADWLATHEPSPSLSGSLRRADLLSAGPVGRRPRRHPEIDAIVESMVRVRTLRELDDLVVDLQHLVDNARARGEFYVSLGERLAAAVERAGPPRPIDEVVGSSGAGSP